VPYALTTLIRPEWGSSLPTNSRVGPVAAFVCDSHPGDKTQPESGRVLAWYDVLPVDARSVQVASAKDEALSVAGRAALTTAFGDRGFDGRAFNAQILALLKTPTGLPIRPLRQSCAALFRGGSWDTHRGG
jgi:hypothetical protein